MTSPETAPAIAISATFTAEPVEESLRFWLDELGWRDAVRFAPFNQVFQQLLDPAGLLAANHSGVNVLLVRLEDWGPDQDDARRRLVDAVRFAARSWSVPILIVFCPSSPEFPAGERAVRAELSGLASVHVVTPDELFDLYPVAPVHDPHSDELGRVPYTPLFFAALGTLVARKIHALRMTPFKVIALDCDDTLWRGVCGEDGPEGVVIDPPRRELQEFMVRQHDAGMLLCLASKNNIEDVVETFRAHPEMPLRLDHFVSHRVNWDSKGHNLHGLAEELRLGLDTFILIDDNPKECSEVKAACPEVLALALPPAEEEIPAFLAHVWAFDRLRVTEEDRRRAALYAVEAERARREREAPSIEDFLRSLQLQIRIQPARPDQLPRVAQLTQRTNQMNFTTVRRTESELQAFLAAGGECLAVEVEDRFGSYGLTGVMLFTGAADALAIDTFLLSCRALGRGVEHRMLRRLGEIARQRGLAVVDAPFVPSPRNRPALLFLDHAGGRYEEPCEGGLRFRFPAEVAAGLDYQPAEAGAAAPPPRPAASVRPVRADYERIASQLRTPEAVLERLAARRRPRAAPRQPGPEPRTGLERELASLWAGLFGLPAVGIHDNFFDLGGHSLMAVRLLARVRERYGVDLSLEVVYAGDFTVAALARAIERNQAEQAGGAGYGELWREIENLSDDQVRALLAGEDASSPG
jgi:FkbH-like protein